MAMQSEDADSESAAGDAAAAANDESLYLRLRRFPLALLSAFNQS